jgi:hypothetical protein
MRAVRSLGLFALLAVFGCGCGDDDDAALADAGADASADAGTTGAIELWGNWAGDKPDGVSFQVALFECPFTMPPAYYSGDDGTIDVATGDVHLLIDDVEPGEWCVMAYIDMVADDGLMPVADLDAVTTTGLENENGAIPVEVVAGQTTLVELTFAVE